LPRCEIDGGAAPAGGVSGILATAGPLTGIGDMS
jgi:hypothetical protein